MKVEFSFHKTKGIFILIPTIVFTFENNNYAIGMAWLCFSTAIELIKKSD